MDFGGGSDGGDGDKRPSGSSGNGSKKNPSYSFGVNPQLMSIVERVERLEQEKKERGDDIRMVYSEAAGQGWDTDALKRLIKRRKKTMDKRREDRAMDDLFDAAVGESVAPMSPGATEKLDPERKDEAKPEAKGKKTEKPDKNDPPGGGGIGGSPADQPTNQPDIIDIIDKLTTPEEPAELEPTFEELTLKARAEGAAAHKAGKKITSCTIPYNSPHRAHWEEGWMASAGSEDGMDVPKALRRKEEPKKGKEAKDESEDEPPFEPNEIDDDNDEAHP